MEIPPQDTGMKRDKNQQNTKHERTECGLTEVKLEHQYEFGEDFRIPKGCHPQKAKSMQRQINAYYISNCSVALQQIYW